jgi:hypothetical protein
MHRYLLSHHDIFMTSPVKEPGFFIRDHIHPSASTEYRKCTEEGYEKLFVHAAGYSVIGDATTEHILFKEAIDRMHQFNPDAKILIMLRNPVDIIYNNHFGRWLARTEPEKSFKKALKRNTQNLDPEYNPQYDYKHMIHCLPENIAHCISLFGRDNVKFTVLERFKKQPEEEYKDILRFLGVDETQIPDFKHYNSTKSVKRRLQLHNLRLFHGFKWGMARFHFTRLILKKIMEKIANTEQTQRPLIPEALKDELQEAFNPTIEALEKVTGEDLSPIK